MKRLHSFILKSFLGPLAFTFFISMFVLLMQFLWRYIDELVGKGLAWTVIAEFLFYVAATLVPMALPLSILLASIMTFGNMGENYELTAMKAAGISLHKIMRPITILVVFISITAFLFSNYVMPVASLKTSSMLYDIKRQNPELILKEGIFTTEIKDMSIRVSKTNKETGMIYDLLIYDHRDWRGNVNVTVADSGIMDISSDKSKMELTLYSGNRFEEVKQDYREKRKENHPTRKLSFKEYKTSIDLPGNKLKRTDENRFRNGYRMLNLKQLESRKDTLLVELKEVKNDYAHMLTNRSFFKKESKFYRNDSIKKKMLLSKTYNTDSLFNTLSTEDKLYSIEKSLLDARKIKDSARQKQGEFTSKMKWIRKFMNEWHRKFTLPFSCLIFFFIGAPLGAIIRKGGLGMPVVISIVFFIIYYIISMTTERSSKELIMTPFWGMWLSSVVILPLGVILTYKAANDSPLFNIENYIDFFKKINPAKLFKKKDA